MPWLISGTAILGCAPAGAQPIYESAFDAYASWRQPARSIEWRDANRQVGDLGGFVGQMRASRNAPSGPQAASQSADAKAETLRGMPELLSTLCGAGASAGGAPVGSTPPDTVPTPACPTPEGGRR